MKLKITDANGNTREVDTDGLPAPGPIDMTDLHLKHSRMYEWDGCPDCGTRNCQCGTSGGGRTPWA